MNNNSADSSRADRLPAGVSDLTEEAMERQAALIAGLGFFVFDPENGSVVACSRRHAAIFGLTPETFIALARDANGVARIVHPDDRAKLREAYVLLAAGSAVELEYRFETPAGRTGLVVEKMVPETDAAGQVIRVLGSSREVVDLRDRQAAAPQPDRFETLGVLTAGIAHDFNNILAVIMGNAQLGQAHQPTVLMNEVLEEILAATNRGARLTRSLLAFAQRATMVPREVSLNAEVEAAISAFRKQHDGAVTLSAELSEQDPRLKIDSEHLQTVLLNILANAQEACGRQDTIVVRTSVRAGGDGRAGNSGTEADTSAVCSVTISDTGRGIAAAVLPRVTEPFFTTKSRAQGSGLGLSMAQGFARQSGGDLAIASEEGKGTDVTLFFPMIEKQSPSALRRTTGTSTIHRARVLVLEDDPAVSDVLRRQLESLGHEVVVTPSPAEVLDLVLSQDFDIGVFDNIVPGTMNGVDVARSLRSRGLDMPIILLTGLPGYLSERHLAYVDALMQKPVPIERLAAKIEELLNREE